MATGSTTSVKIHSSSRRIDPKWVIMITNECVPEAIKAMKNGSPREQMAVRGFETRFNKIEFYQTHRGTSFERNIQLGDDARMSLIVEVMREISGNVPVYKELYERNVMFALYLVEACRVLEEENKEHALFKTSGYREVIEGLITYVEEHQTKTATEEKEESTDLEHMMRVTSKGLGMYDEDRDFKEKQEKIEIAAIEFESTLKEIADAEGIYFNTLWDTPMDEEVRSNP